MPPRDHPRQTDEAPPIQHKADWWRFLCERHLLILEWVAEGKTCEDIARTLSMDPVQVRLISRTPGPHGADRYGQP